MCAAYSMGTDKNGTSRLPSEHLASCGSLVGGVSSKPDTRKYGEQSLVSYLYTVTSYVRG